MEDKDPAAVFVGPTIIFEMSGSLLRDRPTAFLTTHMEHAPQRGVMILLLPCDPQTQMMPVEALAVGKCCWCQQSAADFPGCIPPQASRQRTFNMPSSNYHLLMMCLVFPHSIDTRSIPKDEWVNTGRERSVSFYARWKQALLRWVPEKWEIKTGKLVKVGEGSRREEYQKGELFFLILFSRQDFTS